MLLAQLILAHNNPPQLARLVTRLDSDQTDIYIHIDGKSNIEPFQFALRHCKVRFIVNRVKVHWGGYSMVQATVNSLKEILANKEKYEYIQLLSAQDYPIRPLSQFHEFLYQNKGKAFMHFLSVYDEWQEAIPRVTQYHLINFNFPGMYKVEKLVNKLLPRRKLPNHMEAVGRSQWFTINADCVAYIVDYLDKPSAFRNFFKFSWAPDEMIFQTILYNSPYRECMVNDNLLYLDWSAGLPNPKVLTMADKNAMQTSGKFFARKFSEATDPNILNELDKIIEFHG